MQDTLFKMKDVLTGRWGAVHPMAQPDHLGLIPTFLDPADPRPSKEQIAAAYIGGWHPQGGFTMDKHKTLRYPGDPPMKPLFVTYMPAHNELVLVYEYGYTAIVQLTGSERPFEVARLD